MNNLDVDPQVGQLATAMVIGDLVSSGDYTCPACGCTGGPERDPTSVVIVRIACPPADIAALAHRACLPSRILETSSIAVQPSCDPVAYSWLSSAGTGPAACLLLDYPSGIPVLTSAGETADILLGNLIAAGMTIATPDGPSPSCSRLTAEISADTLLICHGELTLFGSYLEGLTQWALSATAEEQIDLAIGIGVAQPAGLFGEGQSSARLDGGDLQPHLDAAMRAGRVVTARIPVRSADLARPGGTQQEA